MKYLKTYESFKPRRIDPLEDMDDGKRDFFVKKIESHPLVEYFEASSDGFFEIGFKDGSGATATPFWDGTKGISISSHVGDVHGEVIDKKHTNPRSFESFEQFVEWYYSKVEKIHDIVKK